MLDHSVEIATNYFAEISKPHESYDPDCLLDAIIEFLQLKNDADLSRALGVAPPVISKLRHRRIVIRASFLLRAYEATDISIAEMKALAGLPAYVRNPVPNEC